MEISDRIDFIKLFIDFIKITTSTSLKDYLLNIPNYCSTINDREEWLKVNEIDFNDIEVRITDEYCWEAICNLGIDDGMLILAPFIKHEILREMKEALKNKDKNFFFNNMNEDSILLIKLAIFQWRCDTQLLSEISRVIENILIDFEKKQYNSQEHNIVEFLQTKSLINEYLPCERYNILSDISKFKDSKELEYQKYKKENDYKKLFKLPAKIFISTVPVFFDLWNSVWIPDIKKEAISNLFRNFNHSDIIQKFYNKYRKENPEVRDWIIHSDSHEQIIFPKRKLSASFDNFEIDSNPKNSLYFKLTKKKIEFLHGALRDGGYFSDNSDIERFAFFLTGKPKNYKNLEPIEWLGQEQDLACFIGLLCPVKEGIKDGRWERTGETFVCKTKGKVTSNKVTSKALSTIFKRIEKKYKSDKDYKNRSYYYFKKLISKI